MAVSRQGFESGTEAGTEDGGAMWTTDDQQQRRGGAMYYGSDGSSYHHGGGGTDDNNNVGGKGSSIPRASSVGKQAQIGRGGGGSSVVPTRGGATDEGTTSAGGGEATTTIASQAPQPPVTRQHQLRKSAHSISHGGRSTNGGSAGEGGGGTSLSVGGALSTSSHHHHPFLLGGIAGTVSLRTASTIKGGAASIIPLRPLPAAAAVENSTSDVGRRRSPSMNQIREEASAAAAPKLLTPPFVADFVCIDRSRRRYQNGPSQSYREGATAVCNNNTEFNLGGEMNDEPLLVMLPHRQPLPAGGAAETTTRHPSSVASAETVPPSPVLLTPHRGVVHSVLYSSNGGHKADDGSTTTSGVAAATARLTLVALGRNVCIMSAASSDVFIAHDDSSNEDVDQQQHGNETYNVNAARREAPQAITVSSDAAFAVPFVAPSMGLDSSPVSSPEGVDTAAGIATTMWRRVKCTTQSVTTNTDNTQLRREVNSETGGVATQQKPHHHHAGAAPSPRHGNSFTSDRPNALRTLVARREIDAFFAMRYTALVRGCHVKRTLPVSKYPPGIIDLIRGAVGGSARSKEVYSTCVMLLPAKQGVAFCEWHATDDPLRTLLLQAMGWVPCAEDAKMLHDLSSSRSSPTSRGPVDDDMILNFVPRLTSIDLVAPTQSMQEAVERRVGILLLCHRSDLAVAMLMHYSTLHRTYATLAALLRALCDAAAVIPSTSMPPSTSPNALHLATRNFARLRWLHTDLLQLCGGQWLRGLLGVFIWARLQDASNYALKQLEATFGSINCRVAPFTPLTPTTLEEAEVKWVSFCKTEEQAAAVEACRRQVRRPDQQTAAPHASSTNNGHSSSPSSICSSIGWPAPAWRALYASPEAACLTPSHRIEAMQRAVERHARYALGVALLDDPTPEALEELCRAALKAAAGPAATGADGPASNNTAASRRHQQQQQYFASTGAFPLGETTLVGGDATLRFGNATTGTTLSLGSVDDEDEDTRTEEINALTDLLLATIEHHDDRAAGGTTLRSNNGESSEPKVKPNRRYSLDDEDDKRTETCRQQERPTSVAQNMLSLCGVNGNAQLLQNCLGLPITDRVALAALLLPDNSVLYATLKQMATRSPSLASSPLTAVFYGCGDSGARHMQTYVDTTGDVQLAACLFSPYCRPRSSVLPTTHNNTGSPQPHVTANTMAVVPAATPTTSNNNNVPSMVVATTLWNTWNRVYCAALNARGAFHERARHDRDVRVAQTAQLQLERQAKEEAVQRLQQQQQQQQLLTTATIVSLSSAASPSASMAPTFRQHHHHHGSHSSLRSGGSHLASTSATAATASQQLAVLRANDTAVEVRCSCGQLLSPTVSPVCSRSRWCHSVSDPAAVNSLRHARHPHVMFERGVSP
ncbi:Hypothetical protein, putative [Bodo saltans]|uniref:Uncharacterized protein n=1 Tax=Bodo saltans TaxID=75058 RepID=A0A0S4KJW5_BODSA|nr:Hypothetical protein, putative [Bodo saltans]|eukprot:CUI14695.1 Hypothetical protein, putative [Bodo saltans]